tara:strand:- start:316 stop:696 length:381 start_codon:yes stop_codon:yes gene_type:complete
MNNNNVNPQDMDDIVQAALGELLNLAGGVAELQTTDAAAEEIYVMCDIIAEYYGIERATVVTTENSDGSFTTHFEAPEHTTSPVKPTRTNSGLGHIRTSGKPKLRVKDKDTPVDDIEPVDPEDDYT